MQCPAARLYSADSAWQTPTSHETQLSHSITPDGTRLDIPPSEWAENAQAGADDTSQLRKAGRTSPPACAQPGGKPLHHGRVMRHPDLGESYVDLPSGQMSDAACSLPLRPPVRRHVLPVPSANTSHRPPPPRGWPSSAGPQSSGALRSVLAPFMQSRMRSWVSPTTSVILNRM